jgi:hypothetical protein
VPQDLDGKTVAHHKVARRGSAGVARFHERHYAYARIERVALGHDPPPGRIRELLFQAREKPRSVGLSDALVVPA